MNGGNWIPLDKRLAHFLPKKRAYTILEAMFSFSKDMDDGNEKSIIEYSRIWSWSRCKVRRFVSDLKTGARHTPDRDETGVRHEIRIINNNLEEQKDRGKTGARQGQDRGKTPTIDPNPKPYKDIIDDLNQKGNFRYQECEATKRHINARLAEGYTKEDFFHVHSVKIAEWKGTKDAKYLRPETLYGNKFQGYLNQKLPDKSGTPEWW